MSSRLIWLVLLGIAVGVSVSAPAATTLVTCVPLNGISAAPAVTTEETAAEPCAADDGLAPAFVRTPEITRC
jgi:hypothetical protein